MATPDVYARADETPTVDDGPIDMLPVFRLTCLFSEREGFTDRKPREVTILPAANFSGNYTEWITADADVAVDVSEVA